MSSFIKCSFCAHNNDPYASECSECTNELKQMPIKSEIKSPDLSLLVKDVLRKFEHTAYSRGLKLGYLLDLEVMETYSLLESRNKVFSSQSEKTRSLEIVEYLISKRKLQVLSF